MLGERALDAIEELGEHVDLRRHAGHRLDRGEDRAHREDAVEHDAHARLPAGLDRTAGAREVLRGVEHLPAFAEDSLARGREAHAVAASIEERELRLQLELLDRVDERAVLLLERRGGLRERAVAGERVERAGLLEGDVHCRIF